MNLSRIQERMKTAARAIHFHELATPVRVEPDPVRELSMAKISSCDPTLLKIANHFAMQSGNSDTLRVYEELGGTFNSKVRR
jgi:hypothetical protein